MKKFKEKINTWYLKKVGIPFLENRLPKEGNKLLNKKINLQQEIIKVTGELEENNKNLERVRIFRKTEM
ncbi:hypothetical protein [Aquibacillus saliphilus]|uniref:hypothetical protein n=1 Tax=Aquibacillus saliphilus TaxID=1909422 RepID=UPI001CF000F5|nr:hypothetical protein [Aquibacillus saliphilus]